MSTLTLSSDEQAMLDGEHGGGPALAMRIVSGLAGVLGAQRLLPVASAHVDSCLYHGVAGLDFAERLVDLGARTAVPTTLNVGSLDLLHPSLVRADEELATGGRRLMDAYVTLGAEPTWTCAPYQEGHRPAFGQDIAWAESNAIVFANSVLGARTDRYGDFLDICAAITGRAPHAGLHLDANRLGDLIFDLTGLPEALLDDELLYPILGHLVGERSGTRIPVLVGLPADADEPQLKALGAAAASAGGVALFHAVGVTPEAPTLEAALRPAGLPGVGDAGQSSSSARPDTVTVTRDMLRAARNRLCTAGANRIDAVSLGTPHFSVIEFERLAALLRTGPAFHTGVEVYVSSSRKVLAEAESRGLLTPCREAGVHLVADTCTYVTPILRPEIRTVLTNSAKWAYYAPANLGVGVAIGSLEDCVASAREGRIVRAHGSWPDS